MSCGVLRFHLLSDGDEMFLFVASVFGLFDCVQEVVAHLESAGEVCVGDSVRSDVRVVHGAPCGSLILLFDKLCRDRRVELVEKKLEVAQFIYAVAVEDDAGELSVHVATACGAAAVEELSYG
jgi:hypothetical protein